MRNRIELDADWDDVVDWDDDDLDDQTRLSWWEMLAALPNASPETMKLAQAAREVYGGAPE